MLIELAVGGWAVAAAGFAAARLAQRRENRRAILRRILDRVEGELQATWSGDEVRGVWAGRAVRLRLATRLRLGRVPWRRRLEARLLSEEYPLALELELMHAPEVRLRIRRDQGLAALEKRLGLARDVDVSGGDSFDAQFLVEAEDAPVASPLAAEEVRRVVRALLGRWELDEVALRQGRLHLRGRPARVGAIELQALLEAAETLAREFDRAPAPAIHLAPRFAWIGGADRAPRCPYCHELLEDGSPAAQRLAAEPLRLQCETPLLACDRCGTLQHRECFQENQGCPLLGCGGRGWGPAGQPARLLSGKVPVPPEDEPELQLPPEEGPETVGREAPGLELQVPPDER